MHQERENMAAEAVEQGIRDWTTFGISSRSKYDAFYDIHELTYYPDVTNNVYFAKYHGFDSVAADRLEWCAFVRR